MLPQIGAHGISWSPRFWLQYGKDQLSKVVAKSTYDNKKGPTLPTGADESADGEWDSAD